MATGKKKGTAKRAPAKKSPAKRTATADSSAKKAQLKRGAAAKKRGAEGPKRSTPARDVYVLDPGTDDRFKRVPAGSKAPKGTRKGVPAKKIDTKKPIRPRTSGWRLVDNAQSAYGVKKSSPRKKK